MLRQLVAAMLPLQEDTSPAAVQVAERAPPASLSALGDSLRHEFPILDQEVNGKPLAYLDNAATSQKPVQVRRHPCGVWSHVCRICTRSLHIVQL